MGIIPEHAHNMTRVPSDAWGRQFEMEDDALHNAHTTAHGNRNDQPYFTVHRREHHIRLFCTVILIRTAFTCSEKQLPMTKGPWSHRTITEQEASMMRHGR